MIDAFRENLWIVTNAGIAVLYYVLALSLYRLLARFMRINWMIRLGAFTFFLTCALTHVEQAYHMNARPTALYFQLCLSDHMLLIHAIQFLGVGLFVIGVLWALRTEESVNARVRKLLHEELEKRGHAP